MGPTANAGTAPDGRRCPRPARPVTAFGGLSPPLVRSPGFPRSLTGCCRRRRPAELRAGGPALVPGPRSAVAGVSPALPSRPGVSRVSPACRRVPEPRLRVVRYLAFVRRRRGGDAVGRFGSPSGPGPSHPLGCIGVGPHPAPFRRSPIRNGTSACAHVHSGDCEHLTRFVLVLSIGAEISGSRLPSSGRPATTRRVSGTRPARRRATRRRGPADRGTGPGRPA